MELTRLERLSLWNQYEVLKLLDKGRKDYYERCQSILSNGYRARYESLAQHITGDELSEEDTHFVSDVLNMFDALARIGEGGGRKLNIAGSSFAGFDGNNETELMGYARFLIEKEEKWTYLGIKNFNSHMPLRPFYSRMLVEFNKIPPDRQFHLTYEEGQSIIETARFS